MAVGDRLGQLGLAGARRALDQQRLAQPVGEEDGRGDAVVGEVADRGQPVADVGHVRELRNVHGRRVERSSDSLLSQNAILPGSRPGRAEQVVSGNCEKFLELRVQHRLFEDLGRFLPPPGRVDQLR